MGFNSAAYLTTLSSSSSLSTSMPFAPSCLSSASPIGKPFLFPFTLCFVVVDCPPQLLKLFAITAQGESPSASPPRFAEMLTHHFRTPLDDLNIRLVSLFNPHINEETLLDVLVGGGVESSSMYASALRVRQFRFLCLRTVAYPATVSARCRSPLPATIHDRC